MEMTSNLAVVILGILLFGLGLPFVVVGLTTSFQRNTPPEIQGRAFASPDIVIGLPQTISIAVGAGLAAIVDYRILLLAMGVCVAGSGDADPRSRRLIDGSQSPQL